jgi:hypothetical protein
VKSWIVQPAGSENIVPVSAHGFDVTDGCLVFWVSDGGRRNVVAFASGTWRYVEEAKP